jgi:DNA replication protein DnaC
LPPRSGDAPLVPLQGPHQAGHRGTHGSGDRAAAEAFYRVTDAAYERRSVAVTSNLRPSR